MKRLTNQQVNGHRKSFDKQFTRGLKLGNADLVNSTGTTLERRATSACRISGILMLCLVVGCTSLDFSKRIPWLDLDAVVKSPSRITVLWTNSVLNEPGKKGVRGFGGRIMFHGKEQEKPVKVAGKLTVYAFDITNRVNSVPDRKFVFTDEQFATHYSQSKLGHSYSIWLPWDEVGGETRRISLMVRFEPSEAAGMIMSEDSVQILPGISLDPPNEIKDDNDSEGSSGVQQAGYQQPSSTSKGGQPIRRTSLTDSDPIDLPPSFSRRLGMQDSPSAPVKKGVKSTAERTETIPKDETRPASESNDPLGASLERQEPQFVPPAEQLKERQKELVDHFGPRKSRAQKASSARSKPAVPLSQRFPGDEPSAQPRSSSLESKDPFDSDDTPASAGSR